jgi:drug/metabolite transporter (DMT)-like permease
MNDRLSVMQIVMLAGYSVAMAGGQILFKMAALRSPTTGGLGERLAALAQNGYFATAVVLYAGLAVLWVWILSFTPLSRAYVFVALAFAITPFAGGIVFGEPISARLVLGIAFVFVGLVCVAV